MCKLNHSPMPVFPINYLDRDSPPLFHKYFNISIITLQNLLCCAQQSISHFVSPNNIWARWHSLLAHHKGLIRTLGTKCKAMEWQGLLTIAYSLMFTLYSQLPSNTAKAHGHNFNISHVLQFVCKLLFQGNRIPHYNLTISWGKRCHSNWPEYLTQRCNVQSDHTYFSLIGSKNQSMTEFNCTDCCPLSTQHLKL